MDENFQTSTDKFKLGKKWFWIGIVVSFLSLPGGLIYGIALLIEKNRRKEGLVIIIWAIIWTLISFLFIGPWLRTSGLVPQFQVVR